MTIKRYAGDKLVGLSSDTKPTNLPDGATFYETDTLNQYIRSAGSWNKVANTTFSGTTATANGSALLDLSQTWDAGANTVSGIKLNVTDTSSNTYSLLMDLKVNDVTKLMVEKNSTISLYGSNPFRTTIGQYGNIIAYAYTFGWTAVSVTGTQQQGIGIYNNASFYWSSNENKTNINLSLWRDDSDILAQRRSTNPQTYRIYGTYTDSTNYERLSLSANSTAHYITTENEGTGTAKDLYLGANNSTAMTVAANGNIGIGTTNPTSKFHFQSLYGSIRDYGAATRNGIAFYNNAGNLQAWITGNDGLNVTEFKSYTSRLTIGNSGDDLTIDSGNVGIGTTTPSYKLEVNGSVSSNGTVYAEHFDNVSDIKFKENIKTIISSKDIIQNLNPVSFTWKDTGEKSFGLIAQEVEKILPEIVHSKSDNTKTISYIQLIPFLIQIIKEQQEQIDYINNKLDNA